MVRHASSARSLPLSAASLRLKDEAAASSVHAAKAREQRRPVHEGTTASGKVPSAVAVKARKETERSEYLTVTY